MYAGGGFSSIGGEPRFCVAALDAGTGAVRDWYPAPEGIVWSLAVSHGTVYAGGAFKWMGRWPQASFAAISPADAPPPSSPAVFVLSQNAPNPARQNTLIRYSLPAPASVSLTVYDLQGRRVATPLAIAAAGGWSDVSAVPAARLDVFGGDNLESQSELAAHFGLGPDTVATEVAVERLPFACARWLEGDPGQIARMIWPSHSLRARDQRGCTVGLFQAIDDVAFCERRNPDIRFAEISDDPGSITDTALLDRILAEFGIIDAYGHVSVRSERDPDRYLLARSLAPELVTEDDILEYDLAPLMPRFDAEAALELIEREGVAKDWPPLA